ncbi:DNA polymerase III subunit gamma/tau [Pseudohaliea sp.]|uniref:DNA polymerase III subunit gamma/tau n=1 Tax=Pseudohaliea sp. TaxID=2740289 RepID=UPI0032EAD354
MSYQVLARKWRPASFEEMVGQEHVLRALANALDRDQLHHAYLFTGTRGVGKTTVARILAKCLNCEQGVSSRPCGQCSACLEIAEGRSVDLLEVDAASRTRVDDTRELLENVQYAPTRSRYKVYLIDEVHMLSQHSFNALLKTLEEPPPHVKFLLATTDPQKLPATVLSRCLQFNLKNMPAGQVVEHLRHILGAEGVAFEEPALWLLGHAAAGSMRDALSLTDQAIAFGGGRLVEAEVRDMLGTVDRDHVFELLDALAADDAPGLLAVAAAMEAQALDFAAALETLLAVLHRLALAQAVPEALDPEMGDVERLRELAARFTAEDVQLCYQIALNGRRDLPLAADPRAGFDMVLLRMLAFRPAPALPASGDSAPQAAAGEVGRPAKKPEPRRAPAPAAQAGAPPAGPPDEEPPARVPPVQAPAVQRSAVPDPEPRATHRATPAPAPASLPPWHHLVEQLELTGSTRVIARNCEWRACAGSVVSLVLDQEQANLFNARHGERITAALRRVLGDDGWSVAIEPGELAAETPAQRDARLRREAHASAVARLREDPRLGSLLERFAGTLEEESVEVARDAAARGEH